MPLRAGSGSSRPTSSCDASSPLLVLRAPVGEPAVVGADAGQPELELLGGRRPGHERPRGEEWRHGVREDHLGDDPVGFHLGDAPNVVPVARAEIALEILERVLVRAAPAIELVAVCRVEVRAVYLVAPAR